MTRRTAVLALLCILFVAGCARHDSGSDDTRHPVFYGGVSGGLSRP